MFTSREVPRTLARMLPAIICISRVYVFVFSFSSGARGVRRFDVVVAMMGRSSNFGNKNNLLNLFGAGSSSCHARGPVLNLPETRSRMRDILQASPFDPLLFYSLGYLLCTLAALTKKPQNHVLDYPKRWSHVRLCIQLQRPARASAEV